MRDYSKDIRIILVLSLIVIGSVEARTYRRIIPPQISIFTDIYPSGGPKAVADSLFAGLRSLGISFNVNRAIVEELAPIVVVLGNLGFLHWAIQNKQKAGIKVLLAGPNVEFILNKDGQRLALSPEIDGFLANCDWTYRLFWRDVPASRGRTHIWYAGIDSEFWNPGYMHKHNRVLVYEKYQTELAHEVALILEAQGWEVLPIHYGHYDHYVYKDYLSRVAFAVFLSQSESQGMALAEAWSMNVPTIVWNSKQHTAAYLQNFEVSACPYLTQQTGKDWNTLAEFSQILQNIVTLLPTFAPRQWVLEHMTNEISAQKLLDIIEKVAQSRGLENFSVIKENKA